MSRILFDREPKLRAVLQDGSRDDCEEREVINNVLLVKVEGPVWDTIYHQLPAVKGVKKNSMNQPTNGKRTSIEVNLMWGVPKSWRYPNS